MLYTGFSNPEIVEVLKEATGKTITEILIEEEDAELRFSFIDTLKIFFNDGSALYLCNNIMCCEYRYMNTDDDLNYFKDSKLLDVEIRDVEFDEVDSQIHEVQFLVITTSKGALTLENHNVHNGYYGGFDLEACLIVREVENE